MSEWIRVNDELPKSGKSVLVLMNGNVLVAWLNWSHPGHEDDWEAHQYWQSKYDLLIIEWHEITHWMKFPELPEDYKPIGDEND